MGKKDYRLTSDDLMFRKLLQYKIKLTVILLTSTSQNGRQFFVFYSAVFFNFIKFHYKVMKRQ